LRLIGSGLVRLFCYDWVGGREDVQQLSGSGSMANTCMKTATGKDTAGWRRFCRKRYWCLPPAKAKHKEIMDTSRIHELASPVKTIALPDHRHKHTEKDIGHISTLPRNKFHRNRFPIPTAS